MKTTPTEKENIRDNNIRRFENVLFVDISNSTNHPGRMSKTHPNALTL